MKKSCKNGTAASRFSNGNLSRSQFPSSFTGPALMAESRSLEVRRSSSLISPIESSQDDIARHTCEAGGCASQGVRALTALACSAAPRVGAPSATDPLSSSRRRAGALASCRDRRDEGFLRKTDRHRQCEGRATVVPRSICPLSRPDAPGMQRESIGRWAQKIPHLAGLHDLIETYWDRLDLRFGADSLTRTDDLPLTRRLLYQLSYAGTAHILARNTGSAVLSARPRPRRVSRASRADARGRRHSRASTPAIPRYARSIAD